VNASELATFGVVAFVQRAAGFADLPVQVEQIEGDEYTGRFSEQQVLEDRPAFSVDAGDLAIKYVVFDLQMFNDPGCQISKTAKYISISRDQLAFAFRDVRKRTEAVNF